MGRLFQQAYTDKQLTHKGSVIPANAQSFITEWIPFCCMSLGSNTTAGTTARRNRNTSPTTTLKQRPTVNF
ncbi:MAG: hypothetical protein J07HX5_01776 [halophilic archaeon J07HX5]|nr:MAG: hypothetical protein J07HX5_01776 [halophilic archaeon J07HX5]